MQLGPVSCRCEMGSSYYQRFHLASSYHTSVHDNGADRDGSMGILDACRVGDGVGIEEVVAASTMPMRP